MTCRTADRRHQASILTWQAAAEAEASKAAPEGGAGGVGSPRQLAQRAQIDQLRGAVPAAGAATLQLQRNKAGLASAKADRRAERQRRGDRGRQEASRQEPPAFDPGGIGHAPVGDVGVMLTLLMLLGQIHGTSAQPLTTRPPRSPARHSPDIQPEVQGNSTALAAQKPGQVALQQGGPPRTSPARLGMPLMGLLPFNTTTPHVGRSTPANSAALTTPPQPRQPERPLIEDRHNTISARPLTVPTGTPQNITSPARDGNGTAPSSTPKQTGPTRQPPTETSIDKSGRVTFATDDLRKTYETPERRAAIEAVAIKNLMASTATGAGILEELTPHRVDPVILRTALPRGVGGEAALSGDKYITVNSNQDLRRNTIVAAHEFRHREQFASGMLDKNANPYRMAYAEIEAKNVGLDTYVELEDRGYFDDDVLDADSERLDLADRTADPQKYKRTVFNQYLSRYRGTAVDKYPDFASDAALDKHIADQEAYFAARREVSRVEMQIKKLGLSPDDTMNLPETLKTRLQEARAENRKVKRVADKSHP